MSIVKKIRKNYRLVLLISVLLLEAVLFAGFLAYYRQYTVIIKEEFHTLHRLQKQVFGYINYGIRDGRADDMWQDIDTYFNDSILIESPPKLERYRTATDKVQNLADLYYLLTEYEAAYMDELLVNQRLYHFFQWAFFVFIIIHCLAAILHMNGRRIEAENRAYKNHVNEDMLEILEKDRNLISYELHDQLAQNLAQINRFFNNPDMEHESFEVLKKYSSDSIHQVRLVSNRLKSPSMNSINLKETFTQLFSDFRLLTDINLEYKLMGIKKLRLPESKVLHVFRIIQELLNNAHKHSGAEKVTLSMIYSHPEIIVKYRDDGVGYKHESSLNSGIGLSSIQFRMNLLKAEYTQMDTMTGGVSLCFKIPVENDENTID